MKFDLKWLQKLVTVKTAADKLAAQITDAGLEVESVVDNIFDVSVPPNRADCLGMVGIAREVAAINDITFAEPMVKPVAATIQDKITLKVEDSAGCPKYLGRIIKGIDNTRQTPQWIKDCLTIADIKLISPVVDITNYVLLEWGQPLHAFDLHKIAGDVVVRKAHKGEALTLLDDSTVELTPHTLVIADSKKPLAIAGVKGGKDSGIAADTKDILVECAYFEPIGVRLTSRHFNLKTDGAYRFERCIDPSMQEKVMEHVTQMILDVVGGAAGSIVAAIDPQHLPKTTTLSLRLARIEKILGIKIEAPQVMRILQHLGFVVENHNSHGDLMVTAPAFRTDIEREIDLIEEVGRIYGYQNIPAQTTISTLEFKPTPEAVISEKQISNCLVNRGYNEAITYSFIDAEYAKLFILNINPDLCLDNPISSEMGFMRPSLLPSLVKTLQYNQNRQQDRIRLFEIGLRYFGAKDQLQQIKTIAGVCYGNYLPEGWAAPKRLVDLFDIKGDVIALFGMAHNADNLTFNPTTDTAMHPGQCVEIFLYGKPVGKLGALHPNIQQTLGLPNQVFMFEINYDALAQGQVATFNMFAKYPAVRRDIALLLDRKISAAQLETAIKQEVGNLLTDLVLFDVYQGKGIPDNQRSMALGLTLQNTERTLTDAEVNDIFANLMSMLQREFNATLR